jgi:hypothetical protein
MGIRPGDLVEPSKPDKWLDDDVHPYLVISRFVTDRGKELAMSAWRLLDPVKGQEIVQYDHELKKVDG